MAVLGSDVHRANTAANDSGDQYTLRQFVRAAFAMQEAVTYCLKRMALAVDDEEQVLALGERVLLMEVAST